ncbi:TRAF3-interacting protein 1 isoform X1 [Tachysurus ichikawai]
MCCYIKTVISQCVKFKLLVLCVCVRITDSTVKPLKAELAELEQLIMEQQDKICAIKSNILQNEEKIRKMVSSINVSQT